MKKIELTDGQITELALLFEEETDSEGSMRIDNIFIYENGNIQVFYNYDGKPKSRDISIYD